MKNLSTDLKNYLSAPKSQSTSDGSWLQSLSFTNTAQSSESTDDISSQNGSSNGWFAEAQNDPFLPSLTKKQRVLGFMGCLLMGTFCFSLAGLYVPFLLLKARKFAMLYTLGSLFLICSFSLLWGPMNHLKHLLSGQRIVFTTVYFGSLFMTLYFAIWTKSTILTVICAIVQLLAIVWYVVSFIPGGQTGMKFFSKLFYTVVSKTASKTLPV